MLGMLHVVFLVTLLLIDVVADLTGRPMYRCWLHQEHDKNSHGSNYASHRTGYWVADKVIMACWKIPHIYRMTNSCWNTSIEFVDSPATLHSQRVALSHNGSAR